LNSGTIGLTIFQKALNTMYFMLVTFLSFASLGTVNATSSSDESILSDMEEDEEPALKTKSQAKKIIRFQPIH
jgi:hypothetical protein